MLRGADEFGLDVGADYEELSPFNPDYVLPIPELLPEKVVSPIVMYAASRRIRATSGTPLGRVIDPYFNRTVKHFCIGCSGANRAYLWRSPSPTKWPVQSGPC
jgi:hypothetical protein